jgi:hypothetical protein
MSSPFIVGVDLGQTTDYTAVVVLERTQQVEERTQRTIKYYALRHLERIPLGTNYTEVVTRIGRILLEGGLTGAPVVIDQTGVGRAVVDMLHRHLKQTWIVPVTITGGQTTTKTPEGEYHVPKKELITSLQLAFQDHRLSMPKDLPHAQVFIQELLNFRVKITLAANETFSSWREGIHDDLVLAAALATWWGDQYVPWVYVPSEKTELEKTFEKAGLIRAPQIEQWLRGNREEP